MPVLQHNITLRRHPIAVGYQPLDCTRASTRSRRVPCEKTDKREISRRQRVAWQMLLLAVCWLVTAPALAASYPLVPRAQVIGQDLHVQAHYTDTLYDLAQHYGVGSEEMLRANPHVDPWLPGEGTDILIPGRQILPPGPHTGIVINIPEHRLYYYPKPRKHSAQVVITFPVSIGSMDWKTPLGTTRITQKIRHPTWHPPVTVRQEHLKNGDPLPGAVPPGPKNPLGAFAMRLDIQPGDYLIHGTNNPLAVGMPVTHGCIRLYPRDIEALFAMVRVGTKVYLMNRPVKAAVVDGQLLLEAHPPVDAQGQALAPDLAPLQHLLEKTLQGAAVTIDWDRAREAMTLADGIPVTVGVKADPDAPTDASPAAAQAPPSL
jgi:L,D-transpeptidase ErfK/SrfK